MSTSEYKCLETASNTEGIQSLNMVTLRASIYGKYTSRCLRVPPLMIARAQSVGLAGSIVFNNFKNPDSSRFLFAFSVPTITYKCVSCDEGCVLYTAATEVDIVGD